MSPESRRYLRKRKQIVNIILDIQVEYEDWRNEIYTQSSPDINAAIVAAEKILSKFGINKPKEVQ